MTVSNNDTKSINVVLVDLQKQIEELKRKIEELTRKVERAK